MQFVFIGIGLLSFACSFIFKNLFEGRKAIFRVGSIALSLSVFLAFLFSVLFTPTAYCGGLVEITGKIEGVTKGDYSTSLTIKTDTINNEEASYKLLARTENTAFNKILMGDSVYIIGEISPFGNNGSFDAQSYYYSQGYSAEITDLKHIEVRFSDEEFQADFLTSIRRHISDSFKLHTNAQVGGFLAALIMGDRLSLDANTNLTYSMIGISHILALSGMHLVLICEALKRILKLFKMNKKTIIVISTLFCLFYMAVTGFSASVVRSAVMLTITSGLFLVTGIHDSYTTLPLSVIIILLFEPYAIFDLSLWLSVFATLGVIVFGDLESKKPKKKRFFLVSILLWIWESILSTIFAVGASYALMLSFFSSSSVLAPITTLIFSFPINMLIFAGIILLLLGSVLPFLGPVIIYITDTINFAVDKMASWKWSIYSLDFEAVEVLIIIFTVFFYAMLILKLDRKRVAVGIMVFLFLVPSAVGVTLTQVDRFTDHFTYSASTTDESFSINDDGSYTLIYTGNQSKSSAYRLVGGIIDMHIMSVDNLVMTNYTSDTLKFVSTFISRIKTGILYFPKPTTDPEHYIAQDLGTLLESFGTRLDFYEHDEEILLGNYKYSLQFSVPREHQDNPHAIFTVRSENEAYTYLSRGVSTEYEAAARRAIMNPTMKNIIFGANGVGSEEEDLNLTQATGLIKCIYYSKTHPLSYNTQQYFKESKVPIVKIGTSLLYGELYYQDNACINSPPFIHYPREKSNVEEKFYDVSVLHDIFLALTS